MAPKIVPLFDAAAPGVRAQGGDGASASASASAMPKVEINIAHVTDSIDLERAVLAGIRAARLDSRERGTTPHDVWIGHHE